MKRWAVQSIIDALASETEMENVAMILGATIEQLALVTNPETAADICGRAQTMLLDRGSLR